MPAEAVTSADVEAVAEVRSGGKITHDPFWPPRWRSSTVTVPSS